MLSYFFSKAFFLCSSVVNLLIVTQLIFVCGFLFSLNTLADICKMFLGVSCLQKKTFSDFFFFLLPEIRCCEFYITILSRACETVLELKAIEE